MDSSWKSLQIRMEAAWNMRTTPKTKRPKTGDIISKSHLVLGPAFLMFDIANAAESIV